MTEKGKAILAYVFTWVGGLIVLFGFKDNTKNTKIHAAQAIVIGIASAIITDIGLYILTLIFPKSPFFKTFIYGLYIVLIIIGIVKANKDEDPELPVVGNIAKSIFGKKIDE